MSWPRLREWLKSKAIQGKSSLRSNPSVSQQVLQQLDRCVEDGVFPMLDNGYVYLADTRLSTYVNGLDWAIVIEVLGYNPRSRAVDNCLYCFGNRLPDPPGISNSGFIFPMDDGPSAPLIEPGDDISVHPMAIDVQIRGELVSFPRDPAIFLTRGIQFEGSNKIHVYELLRYLVLDHRDLLLATDDEIHRQLGHPMRLLLRLDSWNHPDVAGGQRPSENETFQMIAQVIQNQDPDLFRPNLAPNTHWSNWPDGGLL